MKKKINRILAVVVAIFVAASMTACGGNTAPETTQVPETTAAPTTEPVNVCETNGHAWVDATCDVAKTCSICGETEGEALGHTWVEANYQQPKTCSVCNATEGEPLVSYFEEYGLVETILDKSGEHELETLCSVDTTKTTIGKVTVESYDIFASDETHEALDGYEWRVLTVKLHYSDENMQKYGMYSCNTTYSDYYMTDEGIVDGSDPETVTYIPNWNGVRYTECQRFVEFSDWLVEGKGENMCVDMIITLTCRVPVGYDGVVFVINAPNNEAEIDMEYIGKKLHEIIDDNSLVFRLD